MTQTKTLAVAIGLVLALAAATPVIGATDKRGAIAEEALDISKEAREIAKSAKRGANKARGIANSALATANAANSTASSASTKADNAAGAAADAGAKADAASTAASGAATKADVVAAELAASKSKSATAGGTVTTAEETEYVQLTGGPSVTVTVPASGLIEVWAQVETLDGAVSLFEDGQQVPDQDPDDICSFGGPPPSGSLLSAPGGGPPMTISTPGTPSVVGACGQTSAPAPVLFSTSSGQHTYSLRYASCGCNAPAPAEFSDRFLAVSPIP